MKPGYAALRRVMDIVATVAPDAEDRQTRFERVTGTLNNDSYVEQLGKMTDEEIIGLSKP